MGKGDRREGGPSRRPGGDGSCWERTGDSEREEAGGAAPADPPRG